MATAIKNPNNFGAQFLADLKAANPSLYNQYTTGKIQISPNAQISNGSGGADNKWVITTTGADGTPKWVSFKYSAPITLDNITDQFGNQITYDTNNGKTAVSWFGGTTPYNKAGMNLGQLQVLQYENPQALKEVLNGSTAYSVDMQSMTISKNGKKIAQLEGPLVEVRQPHSFSDGSYYMGGTYISSTPSGSHLFWASTSWDANGNYVGSKQAFDNYNKSPNQPKTINPAVSFYVGDGTPVGKPPTVKGQKVYTNSSTGLYTTTDPNAPVTPPNPPVTTTTVPKPPTPTPTTVPKPTPTPTTVPKPTPTPTTVPKPTPTTVPKPTPTPTTVPKPTPTPTTTPKPTPTPTTTPKPPTTLPKPATVPTTVPKQPTPTTVPNTPTTTPTTNIPGLAPLPGVGDSGSALKWPDRQYFIDHGINDPTILSLAGTNVDMSGYSKTGPNYVRAMMLTLGADNGAKFFSDWKQQGFNPSDYTATSGSKKTAFDNWAKAFIPATINQGWGKVDPTLYSASNGTVTVRTPTTVQTAGGGTAVGGNAPGTSAYSMIQQKLTDWGMEDLIPKFHDYVFNKGVTDGRQLLQALRNEPEYKKIFQGLDVYNKNNPRPLTELQYLANAQQYLNTAEQYGLPTSFFSRQEVGKLIAGGVSPAEFDRRIKNGYNAAMNADDATKKYLAQNGIDMGHLLAYYLDPTKAEPMLTQKTMQSRIQGYAQNVGVRDFNAAMAEELAKRSMPRIASDGTFTPNEDVSQAIKYAGAGAELTGAAPGANAMPVSTTQLIGSQLAGFGGTEQAQSQQAVERAVQAQEAPFKKGGGYTSDQTGVTGAGSVRQ